MHDFYDIAKDILIPGMVGVGTLAVSAIAFMAGRQAQRERQETDRIKADRDAWLSRRRFAVELERYGRDEVTRYQKGDRRLISNATVEELRDAAIACTDPTADGLLAFVFYEVGMARAQGWESVGAVFSIIQQWTESPSSVDLSTDSA